MPTLHPNLFGGETPITEPKRNESRFQRFRRIYNYRKGENGKQCRKCRHHILKQHHGRRYHKCRMMGLSFSEATDIRALGMCDLLAEQRPDHVLAPPIVEGQKFEFFSEREVRVMVRLREGESSERAHDHHVEEQGSSVDGP